MKYWLAPLLAGLCHGQIEFDFSNHTIGKFLEQAVGEVNSFSFEPNVAWSFSNSESQIIKKAPEEMNLNFKEICEKNGFKFEEHSIMTVDGYILRLFRIPGLQREPK